MEELFGNTTNLATEDLRRLENIHKRLGLIVDGVDGRVDEEKGKASHEEPELIEEKK